ncbi:JAB domain-containing protein [Sphingomonas hylomeconis]|uniref:JAB domain-containing protein n=1 Tax=Sphingomonas hylomeconis TaxID=1395958 RepID=A0ABV7SUW1_9SPHN|nr:JAB domain-containing protein [Sphingomonas hylomeconis]
MAIAACLALDGRAVRAASDAVALFADLADADRERCGIAYLDPEWRLLGVRRTPFGTPDGVVMQWRAVIGDILTLDAHAIVLAHNHPGGDPTPSAADLAVTRRLLGAVAALDVRLVDHLVLAGPRWASMRAMGLL